MKRLQMENDAVLAPVDVFSHISCIAGCRVFMSSQGLLLFQNGYQWSMHTAELHLLR